jgi:hypothetical protein
MLTALLEVLEAKEAIITVLQNNVASRVQAGDGVSVNMLYKHATVGTKECQMEKEIVWRYDFNQ